MWLRKDSNLRNRWGVKTAPTVKGDNIPWHESALAVSAYPYALCSFLFLSSTIVLWLCLSAGDPLSTESLWLDALYILNVIAFVFLIREIGYRRRAETTLQKKQAEVAAIEKFVKLGVWSYEIGSDRVEMSAASRRLLSVSSDASIRIADMLNAFNPEHRKELETKISTGATPGRFFTTQARLAANDSAERWIQVVGIAADGNASAHGKCIGLLIDVSGQKHTQLEMDALRHQLSKVVRTEILGGLSGALAHELKQPLTAILSNAQAAERMLKRNPINITELSDTIHDIIEDDSRAGDVIVHLRSLFNNDEKHWTVLDVNQLIQDSLKIAKAELLKRDVELELKLSKTPLVAHGNKIQLQQVVLNLVLNAAEAMNKNASKKIILETRDDAGQSAMISITDRGPGFSSEVQTHLFDPLFTTKSQGLGLGLSLCRSIVIAHGGTLNAVNDPRGGAKFIVSLPITQEGARWPKMKVQQSS